MANLSRKVVLAAIVAANGKLSRKEIAEKVDCDASFVTSCVKGVEKQLEELQMMDENFVPDGQSLTIAQIIAKIKNAYGNNLEKLKPKDSRGRAKLAMSEKLGLDDLEI